jgi:phosphate transport system protein
MTKHFQHDLDNLRRDTLALASSVEEAIYGAIQALQARNIALAQQVISGDDAIDSLENQVGNECLKILALHQPVASDLRMIATALMINTDLERMGDLAVAICERAIVLVGGPTIEVPIKLQRMTDSTTNMVRQALDSFSHLDVRLAERVCQLDDEVDRYNAEIIQELVETMRLKPELIEPALSLFSATRHLERIADHATNIAENVIYLVDGEIVRHRHNLIEKRCS